MTLKSAAYWSFLNSLSTSLRDERDVYYRSLTRTSNDDRDSLPRSYIDERGRWADMNCVEQEYVAGPAWYLVRNDRYSFQGIEDNESVPVWHDHDTGDVQKDISQLCSARSCACLDTLVKIWKERNRRTNTRPGSDGHSTSVSWVNNDQRLISISKNMTTYKISNSPELFWIWIRKCKKSSFLYIWSTFIIYVVIFKNCSAYSKNDDIQIIIWRARSYNVCWDLRNDMSNSWKDF